MVSAPVLPYGDSFVTIVAFVLPLLVCLLFFVFSFKIVKGSDQNLKFMLPMFIISGILFGMVAFLAFKDLLHKFFS